MRSLVVLLLAAALGAPAEAAPSATVRSNVFDVAPTGVAQQFTMACEAGQQLIGGGYSTPSRDLRIVSSYPAGSGWAVQGINTGKLPVALRVEATCLTGGTGKSTVVEAKGQTPSAAVQCPQGTVVTGGGYLTNTTVRTGGAAITGSHPIGDNGWGIDAVPLPVDGVAAPGTQQIEVFGLCLDGAQIASAKTAQLDLTPGTPTCVTTPSVAPICTYPRSAQMSGTCQAGEALSALAHEVTAGTLPAFSVQTSTSSQLSLAATTRDNPPISLRVTTLCLSWPPLPAAAGVSWPIVAGLGLLALLAIALVYQLRSRRTRSRVTSGLDVSVRSAQGTFDFNRLREIP